MRDGRGTSYGGRFQRRSRRPRGRGDRYQHHAQRPEGQTIDDLDGRKADYGHDKLAETIADFCDRWELGVEHLATDGQEVASRLSHSVQAYLKVDQAAKGRMDGIFARPTGPDPAAD